MEKFLTSTKRWLGKVTNVPLFGSMADDLITLIDMLMDYHQGFYKNLPRGILIAAIIALGYALCPVDLILDIIPFVGFLDDAAILMLMLDFFIARDILNYRNWRSRIWDRGRLALREKQAAELISVMGKEHLAAAYLTEEKQIRLLLCSDTAAKTPLRCRSLLADIPLAQLASLGMESWEDIGAFYTEVFQHPRIPWSALGPRPFMPEYDPQAKTDDFVID